MSVYDAINILLITNCDAIKIFNTNDYFDSVHYEFIVEDFEIPMNMYIYKNVLDSNVYYFNLNCHSGIGVIIYEK